MAKLRPHPKAKQKNVACGPRHVLVPALLALAAALVLSGAHRLPGGELFVRLRGSPKLNEFQALQRGVKSMPPAKARPRPESCVDTDPNCEEWAYQGACIDNPDYMKATCCAACSIDTDDPCSTDPSKRPGVYKGDLDHIFQHALETYPQYNPTAMSRDPWVVTFDNLLSDEVTVPYSY